MWIMTVGSGGRGFDGGSFQMSRQIKILNLIYFAETGVWKYAVKFRMGEWYFILSKKSRLLKFLHIY